MIFSGQYFDLVGDKMALQFYTTVIYNMLQMFNANILAKSRYIEYYR
jgi:hypothetical protein